MSKPPAPPQPGLYQDSCGTRYEYRAGRFGLGLYRADAPADAEPVQNKEAFTKSQQWPVFQKLP